MKSRIFNIMQYEKHPETQEELLNEDTIIKALSHKTIQNWAYIKHDKDFFNDEDEAADPSHESGTKKPSHWHIVVQAGSNAIELSTIAKWFQIPENFIDVPKGMGPGKFLDCVEYLTHEHPRQQMKHKHLYEDSEVISNFDFREKLNLRKKNNEKYGRDLSLKDRMRFDVLYEGKTLRQCIEEDRYAYMDDIETLKKLRLYYISSQRPPSTRINYYVYGKGGSGKGLMSRAIARSMYPQLKDDEDIFFEVGAKGAAFEGYDGQPVIIWNDRRAIDLLQELNGRGNVFNVFDTHPTKQKQNIKYGSINLCNVVNIVNSVQDYIDFLEGLSGGYTDKNGDVHEAEDKDQSYRRFPFIIPIHTEDFDLLLNKGFVDNTDDYEEYIVHKAIVGNMRKIHSICGSNEKLAKEIESKTVRIVTDQVNDVLTKLEGSVDEKDEDLVRAMFSDFGYQREKTAQMTINDFIQIPNEKLPFD